jgi:hypothetical protein
MTINAADLKLVKSQVMDDVPEGGGAPTNTEIIDGASNEIFPDVSEFDRAGGRVKLRKVAVRVDTPNRDMFQGANVIVAEPPDDPNISATLFNTGNYFDRRADAVSRIESYLSIGVQYAGYLYGNHISGQDTLLVFQRTNDLPGIGDTLVLTKREGFGDEFQQYVRITEASAEERTFEDDKGVYTRWVLELRLANTLVQDFPGFDMSRYEYTKAQIAQLTKLSDTVVADAARYYGVAKLAEVGSIGDFSIKADSIFTQLVPSAQIETSLADSRTNALKAGVVAAGNKITLALNAVFSTAQNLFIGGAVAPGTLTLIGNGVTLTDSGGRLMNAGLQVGTIDYENGVLQLIINVFGLAGVAFSLEYAPAAAPQAVTQSQGFEVKIATQSRSYVRTIEPAPVPGTLSVSYMAQGRWYVLREQGDGSIRGADSSIGSGMLNPSTGTISTTFGALPDVGSFVIYQWVEPEAARDADQLQLDNDGKFYWPFNTSGESSLVAGAKAITPGELVITWDDAGTPKTATDDGLGSLTGDASGRVAYARGVIRVSPNVLPAPGTTFNVSIGSTAKTAATLTIASGSGSFGMTGITPGSVEFVVEGQLRGQYLLTGVINWGPAASYRISDDGNGVLRAHFGDRTVNVGTINYAAGTFVLNANTVIPSDIAAQVVAWDNVYLLMDEDTPPIWQYDAVA